MSTHRERRRPVLIIQHAPHEHPAAIRRALESQGIDTLWIHPYRGDALPRSTEIHGLISLGGPMSANDEAEHSWIQPEIRLMKQCFEEGHPIAGICLGGQLLARALGSRVEKNHVLELGWFPLEVTPDGREDPIMGAAGSQPLVYHWHGETFHLPEGAKLLAQSGGCSRQAYKVGDRVYGFQFHPEADHQLVTEWLSIEGVEEEIALTQKHHGLDTVQDADTQRNHALRGESASLKITAAIGALFRRRDPQRKTRHTFSEIQNWVTHRTQLLIEFESSQRKTVHLQGEITTCLKIPAGKFVIFKETNTLLWPIRLEDILRISPQS